MLTEETKQRLYALARDDSERQHLLVAFQAYQQDTETESVHQLFGHLARVTLFGGAALAVATGVYWVSQLVDGLIAERVASLTALGSFAMTLIAIAVSFWGERGAKREEQWRVTAQRYGFPLILVLGIAVGYWAKGHFERQSDTYKAREIAVVACLQSAQCLRLAKELNWGNDVRWVLAP